MRDEDDPFEAQWHGLGASANPGRAIRFGQAAMVELEVQKQELTESLREAELDAQRFRAMFEEAPLPALLLDRSGVVCVANRAVAKVFGFGEPARLQNRSIFRLLEQQGAGRLYDCIAALGQEDVALERSIVVHDIVPKAQVAEARVLAAHMARVPDFAGDGLAIQVVFIDRTAEAERDRHLRFQEAFLAECPTVMHAFDLDGNLAWSSRPTQEHMALGAQRGDGSKDTVEGMLGSRAMDIEVLVSGQQRTAQRTFVTPAGEKRNYLIQKFPMRDRRGANIAVGGISTDITDLVETRAALGAAFSDVATAGVLDPLTGLLNRAGFMDRLRAALDSCIENGGNVMLGFIDIDSFKEINDAMGHEVGDGLLSAFGSRLVEAVDGKGEVARFGGDEFLFFLKDRSTEEAEACLSRILDHIRTPYEIAGTQMLLTCSVGLSNFPKDAASADDLLRNADLAVYASKSGGRDRITSFDDSMRRNSERRLQILSALRHALSQENFRLVYQPKFRIDDTETVVGAEALLRWRDPKLGEIGPMEFIPMAELNGLSNALDLRVLKLFATQQKAWLERGIRVPVAVNISALSLHAASFVPTLLGLLEFNGIAPEMLMLEVTETATMRQSSEIGERLRMLSAAGIRVSIDDFGIGYSSLAYLNDLNPSELKIDRSFVASLGKPGGATERIVQAILALGRSLGVEVVAEGIETEFQRQWLAANGCKTGQGFLVSRPLERDDFERFLGAVGPRGV